MSLVGRRAAGAQLRHRHAEFVRLEHGEAAGQLGRGGPGAEPDDFVAGHRGVDELARERDIGQGHRLRGDVEIDTVPGDERVDRVEVTLGDAVQLGDPPVGDHQARFGIMRRAQRDQAQVGVLGREAVQVDPLPVHEADPAYFPPRQGLAALGRLGATAGTAAPPGRQPPWRSLPLAHFRKSGISRSSSSSKTTGRRRLVATSNVLPAFSVYERRAEPAAGVV